MKMHLHRNVHLAWQHVRRFSHALAEINRRHLLLPYDGLQPRNLIGQRYDTDVAFITIKHHYLSFFGCYIKSLITRELVSGLVLFSLFFFRLYNFEKKKLQTPQMFCFCIISSITGTRALLGTISMLKAPLITLIKETISPKLSFYFHGNRRAN